MSRYQLRIHTKKKAREVAITELQTIQATKSKMNGIEYVGRFILYSAEMRPLYFWHSGLTQLEAFGAILARCFKTRPVLYRVALLQTPWNMSWSAELQAQRCRHLQWSTEMCSAARFSYSGSESAYQEKQQGLFKHTRCLQYLAPCTVCIY